MKNSLTKPAPASSTPPRTMRAAQIVAPQRVETAHVPIPEPGPGQVRVRIEGCGVCASNVPPWDGRAWFTYPFKPGALGHEGWGVIDAIGEEVDPLTPGQRVAFLSSHAFAECDLANADAVAPIPDALQGRPVPGEPLGCAWNVLERSEITADHRVALVGAGFMGLLLIRRISELGASVLAISRRESSCRAARQMGAAATLALDRPGVIEQASAWTGGEGFDCVIEATGYQQPLDIAAALTKVRGRLVIAGFHQDGTREIDMQMWNWRGLDVINAHERDPAIYRRGMMRALDKLAQRPGEVDALFTHHYPLDRLNDALAATRDRPDGFIKALVHMNQ